MEVDDTQEMDMDKDDTHGDKDKKDEETTKVNEQAQDKKDTKLEKTLDHIEGTEAKEATKARRTRRRTDDTKGTKAKAAKRDGTDKDDTAKQEKPDHVDLAFSSFVQNMRASNIGKATTTPQRKRLVESSIGEQQIPLLGGQRLLEFRRTETSALDTRSSRSMNAMASGSEDGQRVPTPDAALKADLSIALAAAVETRTAVASTEEPMTLCKDTNISEAETQPSKANASASGVQLALIAGGRIGRTHCFNDRFQELQPAIFKPNPNASPTQSRSTPPHSIPPHPTSP